jgi:hypothetical protein
VIEALVRRKPELILRLDYDRNTVLHTMCESLDGHKLLEKMLDYKETREVRA